MFATSEKYFQLLKARIQEENWRNSKDSLRPPLHTSKRKSWLIQQTIFKILFLQYNLRYARVKTKQEVRTVQLTKHRK